MLGGPSGATIGALFGATSYLFGRPVEVLCERALSETGIFPKVARAVAGFFAGVAATWGALNLLGLPISFTATLVLTTVTLGIGIACAGGIATVVALIALITFIAMKSCEQNRFSSTNLV